MVDGDSKAPLLNELKPAETAGRDTIARYQAQFRAAAHECLAILSGETIDRVYCDFQDDFVTREQADGATIYHFYQVKTKAKLNYQWDKFDLFGLYKKKKHNVQKVASSFVGKLMVHTIRFKANCGSVVFLTNVQVNDDVEKFISDLETTDFSNADLKAFVQMFNDAFIADEMLDKQEIVEHIRKLILKPGATHLNPYDHDFDALARQAIFEYSEIDLQRRECEEILKNLVDLVKFKSFSKLIADLKEEDLDDIAGIGISDLLEIFAISKGAYSNLQSGGDPNAVKNASIIQRKLLESEAGEEVVEYCTKCKVDWDIWLRENRHTLLEYDLNYLLAELNGIKNSWVTKHESFGDLRKDIDKLWGAVSELALTGTLTKAHLLGGVFSALVKSEA